MKMSRQKGSSESVTGTAILGFGKHVEHNEGMEYLLSPQHVQRRAG